MNEFPKPPVHERWAHLRFWVVGPLLAAPPARGVTAGLSSDTQSSAFRDDTRFPAPSSGELRFRPRLLVALPALVWVKERT
jgi:hypothetical protein